MVKKIVNLLDNIVIFIGEKTFKTLQTQTIYAFYISTNIRPVFILQMENEFRR